MQNKVTLEHTRTTLVTFIVLLVFLVGLCFWMITPFVLAIVMGAILSLLANPLFNKLHERGVPKTIASAFVTIGILLLVIIPISIFLSLAIKQGMSLAQAASENNTLSLQALSLNLSNSPLLEITGSTPEELNRKILELIQSAGKSGMTLALGFVSEIPNIIMQIVLACIVCFFLLLDGKRLFVWLKDKIPLDNDIRERVSISFRDTALSSVWATLAAGAAQSTVIFFGFLILGVPGLFLATGATFIFAWIPLVGCSPIWITGAIYLYSAGSIGKAIGMIAFGMFAGIIDNIVRPLVLKGKSNMHPLVSLIAIFGGIGFFGIMGVFLGPILAAVTISILHIWPAVAQRFGLMTPDMR